MLARVRQIRERDSLFVDTLQDYYNGFAQQMSAPYQDWRRESYTEGLAYKELRQQAAMRTVAGIAAIVGGIAMQSNDSASTRRRHRGHTRRRRDDQTAWTSAESNARRDAAGTQPGRWARDQPAGHQARQAQRDADRYRRAAVRPVARSAAGDLRANR
jgi:hypothetical protein